MHKFVLLSLIAASPIVQAEDPSEQEVLAGITRAAIMAILPSADGSVESCRFEMIEELPTAEPDPNFQLSETFLAEACRKLSKQSNWSVSRDENGQIKEVFDYCMWSKVVPNSPICRAELGE